MIRNLFYCLLLFALFSDQVKSGKLPKTWKTCKKSDPNVNECLKGAIENAIHELAVGNPSLGVLPVDPLRFKKISMDSGNGPVSLKIEFTDLDVIGFKDIQITSVENDWKVMRFEGLMNMILEGHYTADGKVLVVPLNGDGHCRISFEKLILKFELKFKETQKNGKHFLEVTSFTLNMDPELMRMQFDNLFKGNKALGDSTNIFLNENWREILKELIPSISKAFGEGYREISNRILSKISLEEITPA